MCTLNTAPRSLCEPQTESIGKEEKPSFVWVSIDAYPSNFILTDFISLAFDVSIIPCWWDIEEVKDCNVKKAVCIILSPPWKGEESKFSSPKEILEYIQNIFPGVPILWLAPDINDVPDYILRPTSWVKIFNSEQLETTRALLRTISSLTGFEPRITFPD